MKISLKPKSIKLTDIGFKRVMNKNFPVKRKMLRSFMKCNKCKEKTYYDYVPYSLSNPLMVPNCDHNYYNHYKVF